MRLPPRANSPNKLCGGDLVQFPSASVFDRAGRAACAAGCVQRKEFHESFAGAQLVVDHFFNETDAAARPSHVVDVAAGHGMLGWLVLALVAALAPRAPGALPTVFAVDRRMPPSAAALRDAFVCEWPELGARHRYIVADAEQLAPRQGALLVAMHACGGLSDVVLQKAVDCGASVAVAPCCHSLRTARLPRARLDTAFRRAGEDGDLASALDAERSGHLRDAGFRVTERRLDRAITPMNRVLLGHAPPRPEPPRQRNGAPFAGNAFQQRLPEPPAVWRSS
ncbi:hypothetical protein M885DRAFT_516447 [Pelagophyceae sp. CCMP2097]|nr:hypothetical protein M885DRAFT_516447 [Pelagophyceae sp. CCMP2097]